MDKRKKRIINGFDRLLNSLDQAKRAGFTWLAVTSCVNETVVDSWGSHFYQNSGQRAGDGV